MNPLLQPVSAGQASASFEYSRLILINSIAFLFKLFYLFLSYILFASELMLDCFLFGSGEASILLGTNQSIGLTLSPYTDLFEVCFSCRPSGRLRSLELSSFGKKETCRLGVVRQLDELQDDV